mgnify:CR=1 FL=1
MKTLSAFGAKLRTIPLIGICILAVFGGIVSAHSQTSKQAIKLEDYYAIERVSSPAISPDGKRVAYVKTRILEAENRRRSEIWLAPVDGSHSPIRLTTPAFNAVNPRWSPDGVLLAFESTRKVDGSAEQSKTKYWFLKMDGTPGEAYQIPGLEGAPIFSPDNKWIAFTKRLEPQRAFPKTEREKLLASRFEGRIYDWMNFRFDRRGYLNDPRDPDATPSLEVFLLPRAGGEARRLTEMGVDVRGVTWQPSSTALAFTADVYQRDELSYERADLWMVDINGKVHRLTEDAYHYFNPAWSPDGTAIAVLGYESLNEIIARKQNYGSPTDVFWLSAGGGGPDNMTADWDLIPSNPVWRSDGRQILFSAVTKGNRHLFSVPTGGGEIQQLTEGERWLSDFSFASEYPRMAYQATTPESPGEIKSANLDGSFEAKITNNNAEFLGNREIGKVRQIEFKSKDGTKIQGWLHFPPDYSQLGGPYPMILQIHGGPHGAYGNNFNFQRHLYAASGYVILYINPRASVGYGEKFRWATWGGWGKLDYEDLMAGVDHVLKSYPVDANRLGVTGYSYGGFMTNWIITQTRRFKAAVAGASISNWISDYGVADIPRTKESEFFGPPWEKQGRELLLKYSPIIYAGNVATPTLFIHGEADLRVPIEEAEQMYVALKKNRVPARFVRYPDMYHGGWTPWNMVHRYDQELKWWRKYISPIHSFPAE